jgi:hypothetical protein
MSEFNHLAPPKPPAALILTYKRKQNLPRILNSLRDGGCEQIYLSVDGSRDFRDSSTTVEILNTVEDFCTSSNIKLHTKINPTNLGLSLSILSALDWFFATETKGIVIEDDLVFDSDFIKFAEEALVLFESDSDTWIISGNRFDNQDDSNKSISWSSYPMIWGWATWASKWSDIRDSILSEDLVKTQNISFRSFQYWRTGIRRVNLGILNSWAAPLAAQMKARGKYCVLPPVNLVSNIGIDVNAEHTSSRVWHSERPILKLPLFISFDATNRKRIASENDSLFEEKIYRIGWQSNFSYIASKIFDIARFPRKLRTKSLRERFKEISN